MGSGGGATHPPHCQSEAGTEVRGLPWLTPEEVHQLIGTVVAVPQVRNEMVRVSGFQVSQLDDSQYDDMAEFGLVCATSRDAHFVARRLTSYYLIGPTGLRYNMKVTRMVSPEDEDKAAAEARVQVSPVELPPGSDATPADRNQRRGRGPPKRDDEDAFAGGGVVSGSDEEELLICEQCHVIADVTYAKRTKQTWACDANGKLGLNCKCHGLLFCNSSCLGNHQRGDIPEIPPKSVLDYKAKQSYENAQNLLLLQAHQFRLLESRRERRRWRKKLSAGRQPKERITSHLLKKEFVPESSTKVRM